MADRRLYAVLLHKPQQLLGVDGDQIYVGLQQLKESGLVQKIGVSTPTMTRVTSEKDKL